MKESLAEQLWKEPHYGRCPVCGGFGQLLRHHLVTRQRVKVERGDQWDLRNALSLGRGFCHDHANHHAGSRKLHLSLIPDAGIEFAIELLGPHRAAIYFRRYYSGEDPRIDKLEETDDNV